MTWRICFCVKQIPSGHLYESMNQTEDLGYVNLAVSEESVARFLILHGQTLKSNNVSFDQGTIGIPDETLVRPQDFLNEHEFTKYISLKEQARQRYADES